MAIPAETIENTIEFIRNSDDFVTSDQLFKKFGVFPSAYKDNLNFVDFVSGVDLEEAFRENSILMFVFRPQARFYDPNSADFDPEWAYGIEGDPNFNQIYLISCANYQKMISGMLELFLMSSENEVLLSDTISFLNSTLIQILALEEATGIYDVRFVQTHSILQIIKFSQLFELITELRHAPIERSRVVLTSRNVTSSKRINLVQSLVSAFNRLKVKSLAIEKLCLALTMDKDFKALPKPVRVEELLSVLNGLPRFTIHDSDVRMLEINELLVSLESDRYSELSRLTNLSPGSGLLLFKFIGDQFPLAEAVDYVELRPIVYMAVETDFLAAKLSDIPLNYPELAEILSSLLKDSDINSWVKENIRFAFIHEDIQQLRIVFDSLLKDFSPILNLKKNPGNLFRGMIEEKLKESR